VPTISLILYDVTRCRNSFCCWQSALHGWRHSAIRTCGNTKSLWLTDFLIC